MTLAQRIADVENEMARTQKNKATAHHLGILKAKLAKLKRELIEGPKSGAGPAGPGEGFDVSKSGDARVGLIGFPSVGKSTLLTKLTGTESKIAEYEFTTLTCIPGVVNFKGARIQLLDLPGIIEGAKDGRGRGRQVIAVGRTCNLILITLDASKPLTHKKLIEHELEGFGIRLNKAPPDIVMRRKEKGGISISKTCDLSRLDDDTIKSILHEYKISNADLTFRCDATEDELIDIIEGNRKYIPCLYVLNKIDAITMEELEVISQIPHYIPISAHLEWNLDELMERTWEYLDLIRIYTKPKGQIPDYNAPVIIPRNKNRMEDFCNRIHKSMIKNFKHALVWGSSVKHNPQKVGKDHTLADEDVVQIIKKIK
jgi:small GTP-binding protein